MVGVGQNLQIHRKIISKQVFGSSKSYFKKRWRKVFPCSDPFFKSPSDFVFLWGRERGWHRMLKHLKIMFGKWGFVFFVCLFLNAPVLIFSPSTVLISSGIKSAPKRRNLANSGPHNLLQLSSQGTWERVADVDELNSAGASACQPRTTGHSEPVNLCQPGWPFPLGPV